jgi:hypothetical protein
MDAMHKVRELSAARAWLLEPYFQESLAPQHPLAKRLYALWQAAERCDGLPTRDFFSFELLAENGLLGQVFLLEPIAGGLDWRYRLLGTKLVWMFGHDVTHMPFSTFLRPAEASQAIAMSNRAAEDRAALFLRGRYSYNGELGDVESMSLPVLSRCGGEVWLLGASFPTGTNTASSSLL